MQFFHLWLHQQFTQLLNRLTLKLGSPFVLVANVAFVYAVDVVVNCAAVVLASWASGYLLEFVGRQHFVVFVSAGMVVAVFVADAD